MKLWKKEGERGGKARRIMKLWKKEGERGGKARAKA